MKIIEPSFVIETPLKGEEIIRIIERIGRVAYKSEDRITSSSARKFVANVIRRKHFSVIEHISVTVRMICDRGISHELVRHRLASFTQESTRYCNYTSSAHNPDREVCVIAPNFVSGSRDRSTMDRMLFTWHKAMLAATEAYDTLIELGATPQEARSVLPNSLKTEIVMTANLREWRHFFELRTASDAHFQMREIAIPLLDRFKTLIPIIFDDIGAKNEVEM